jgi:D-beta-D-heptose 7-phosphate kinase/D-beta-D-heptose 1-phosphate adenosyltransferase
LASLKPVSVLVVGDLMLDEYLYGAVDRISPEAPVQVVSWRDQKSGLGGAANVANNLVRAGCRVFLAGVVGSDPAGEELLKNASSAGIDTADVITDPKRPTTLKTRVIAHGQQVIRIDREARDQIAADTKGALLEHLRRRIHMVDGVIMSDYAKGVLTAELCTTTIDAAQKECKRVLVDPKGHDFTKYSGAFLLTPNKAELSQATQLPVRNNEEIRRAALALFARTGCEAILVTRSEEGMSLYGKEGAETHIQTEARGVFDITGAGDTVISMLARVLFADHDLETAARLANIAAGIKVGKFGAAPVSIEEISTWIHEHENAGRQKLVELSQAKQLVSLARSQSRKVVFTNGCFDLLHAGHVQLLQKAKALGQFLIVAINDDACVRQLKGSGRPVIPARDRAKIIAALEPVDYVMIFSELTPVRLIKELMPDILVKGGNYRLEEVVGREEVEKYGGRVVLIPTTEAHSSSQMIKEIVARYQFSSESPD